MLQVIPFDFLTPNQAKFFPEDIVKATIITMWIGEAKVCHPDDPEKVANGIFGGTLGKPSSSCMALVNNPSLGCQLLRRARIKQEDEKNAYGLTVASQQFRKGQIVAPLDSLPYEREVRCRWTAAAWVPSCLPLRPTLGWNVERSPRPRHTEPFGPAIPWAHSLEHTTTNLRAPRESQNAECSCGVRWDCSLRKKRAALSFSLLVWSRCTFCWRASITGVSRNVFNHSAEFLRYYLWVYKFIETQWQEVAVLQAAEIPASSSVWSSSVYLSGWGLRHRLVTSYFGSDIVLYFTWMVLLAVEENMDMVSAVAVESICQRILLRST